MKSIAFQDEAVEKMIKHIKELWPSRERQIPIVFKAPTGSGKTYMTEKMICDLAEQPDWDQNVAYVWITFSDDLAMQSKEKFDKYFPTSKHGRLLTIEDFNLGALQKNDVLFLNWQKLVSQAAENRIYRRPDDPRMRHESRVYFEDFVDNSHENGIEIILIIDEAHLNLTDASQRDVIDPLDPKIKLLVSATPKKETIPTQDEIEDGKAGYVRIKHKDVVDAGLIKANLICQTKEELSKYEYEDEDHILLRLAIDRRNELKKEIESFGANVNPLVIIQLPNDDEELTKEGKPTKEEITKEYLISQGVKANRIASWFTGKKKPEGLELDDSEYEYLLFKTAAGTGWDCPRAQVLVMFRDVKSEIFHTQTIGRILRVPIMNEEVSKVFRNGYIYTNCSRKAVEEAEYTEQGNRPKTLIAHNKKGKDYVVDYKLLTDFISRVDYGDLGKSGEFQQCLFDTFNAYFGIKEDDILNATLLQEKISAKGLDVSADFKHQIAVNGICHEYEKIGLLLKESDVISREWSRSDVQKLFSLHLVNILRSQTDNDCKVGNIVRSVPTLKSAIRLWFKIYALPNENEDRWYRVFLNDVVNKDDSSLFRRLITDTLKNYHPLLEEQLQKRREKNETRESEPFVLRKMYAFTEEYEALPETKCLLTPFYLQKNYVGRKTEEAFAKFLEQQDCIEWWFKNGDNGKDWLAIRYYNEVKQEDALFYPDWIYKKKDGTIGLFDTKGGQTAASTETKNKAEALQKRLCVLNGLNRELFHYEGGIVRKENGMWYYNDNANYSYQEGSTDGWKLFAELFNSASVHKDVKYEIAAADDTMMAAEDGVC
ncbi:MAG: DEAD/DEAH box helicase family protein [Prevotellaceae bacterium]|nr:DEAD/DEAH box helicase family protein [Candidatus Minthosoma equi]